MRFTCAKRFGEYPFAHRAPNHEGHCRLIHGHNWTFEVIFAAESRDENGFVVDFGKLKRLRQALAHIFDHTLVLNRDDPMRDEIKAFLSAQGIDNIVLLKDCSCEGLARLVCEIAEPIVQEASEGRAHVLQATAYEDMSNCATYRQ